MRNIVLIFTFFLTSAIQAAPETCGDLKKALEADMISEFSFNCAGDSSCMSLKTKQLRAAVEFMYGDEVPHLSDAKLAKLFKPKFTKIYFGKDVFDGVITTLFDQPFTTYFKAGTVNREKFFVDSEDVKVSLEEEECYDVELTPYHSDARKHNACLQAVKWVNRKVTDIQYDVDDCTYVNNEMVITPTSQSTAKLSIDGKLHNFLGYFCTMELNRTTEALTSLRCKLTGMNASDYN